MLRCETRTGARSGLDFPRARQQAGDRTVEPPRDPASLGRKGRRGRRARGRARHPGIGLISAVKESVMKATPPSYGTASAPAAADGGADPVGRRVEDRYPALSRVKRPPAAGEPGFLRRSMASTAVLALFVFAVTTASYRRQMPEGASGAPAAKTGAAFTQVGGLVPWLLRLCVPTAHSCCLAVLLLKV